MPVCSARLAAEPAKQRQPSESWQCHWQKQRRWTHQHRCQATSEGPGQGEPDMTEEEVAEIAAAFKKMLEDGIGEDLPEMPQGGEVRLCIDAVLMHSGTMTVLLWPTSHRHAR